MRDDIRNLLHFQLVAAMRQHCEGRLKVPPALFAELVAPVLEVFGPSIEALERWGSWCHTEAGQDGAAFDEAVEGTPAWAFPTPPRRRSIRDDREADVPRMQPGRSYCFHAPKDYVMQVISTKGAAEILADWPGTDAGAIAQIAADPRDVFAFGCDNPLPTGHCGGHAPQTETRETP